MFNVGDRVQLRGEIGPDSREGNVTWADETRVMVQWDGWSKAVQQGPLSIEKVAEVRGLRIGTAVMAQSALLGQMTGHVVSFVSDRFVLVQWDQVEPPQQEWIGDLTVSTHH